MSDDPIPVPTDAEMDSRHGGDGYDAMWGARIVPDTLKRVDAAIKRLEKRAKEREKEGKGA
jgi:hypothetical protein